MLEQVVVTEQMASVPWMGTWLRQQSCARCGSAQSLTSERGAALVSALSLTRGAILGWLCDRCITAPGNPLKF